MDERVAGGSSNRVGPAEDVLTEFGVTRQDFVHRFREILLRNPPSALDQTDVAALLRVCRA